MRGRIAAKSLRQMLRPSTTPSESSFFPSNSRRIVSSSTRFAHEVDVEGVDGQV